MAAWLRHDQPSEIVEPKNGQYFTLEELQQYVDGFIEYIYFGEEVMVVNEEGLCFNLPVNEKAMHILRLAKEQGFPIPLHDGIRGDVLVCKLTEADDPEDDDV